MRYGRHPAEFGSPGVRLRLQRLIMDPAERRHKTPFTIDADMDLGPWTASWLRLHGPDVTVRRGAVPTTLPSPDARGRFWQCSPGRTLIVFPSGVRFLVENGESIRYEVDSGATTRAGARVDDVHLRALFWAIPFTALVLQRGLLAIHASGVSVAEDVVAFAGASGAGKSTLAAALAGRGYALFTDDVLIVDPDAGDEGLPCWGFQNLKLFPDAIDLARAVGGYRVRNGRKEKENRVKHYAEPQRRAKRLAGTLRLLGLLIAGSESGHAQRTRVDRLSGKYAVKACFHSLQYPRLAFAVSGSPRMFERLASVAGLTEVFEFRRFMDTGRFQADVAHLMRELPTPATA